MANSTLPPLPSPLLAPLTDDPYLIGLLSELIGEDAVSVRQRLEREQRDLGRNVRDSLAEWGLEPHVWQERLADFYNQTDSFLFETLVWNRHPVKIKMRQWVGEFLQSDGDGEGGLRILTYGDGLGIDSLYLTLAGHQVDYFEVSKQCIRFAKSLAGRLGTSLNLIESEEEIIRHSYDAVVCLDVLEHVPDPQKLVRDLASYLKPGARLIVHAPFWHIHPAAVTHLKSNQKFSGDLARLYQPAGLRLIDGVFFWSPIVLELTEGTRQRTSISWAKRMSLGLGGLLLSVARYWNWPHLVISGHGSKKVS